MNSLLKYFLQRGVSFAVAMTTLAVSLSTMQAQNHNPEFTVSSVALLGGDNILIGANDNEVSGLIQDVRLYYRDNNTYDGGSTTTLEWVDGLGKVFAFEKVGNTYSKGFKSGVTSWDNEDFGKWVWESDELSNYDGSHIYFQGKADHIDPQTGELKSYAGHTVRLKAYNSGERSIAFDKTFTLLKVDVTEVCFEAPTGETNYHELKSDDLSVTYSAPQWVDANGDGDALDAGDKNYPVAFTSNTKPEIGVKFDLGTGLSGQTIKFKATGPGGIAIPPTDLPSSNRYVTIAPVESTGAFVDTIKHYDSETAGKEFELNWEMQIGSSSWFSIGETKHTLYLTLADPVTTLRQETLFEISCRNADGINQANQVTEAIWSEFTDRVVKRVDGHQLTYYSNYTCSVTSTEGLLANGDGQCGSWAKFFIDLRKIHGIDDSNEYIIFEPIADNGFAVKNWSFTAFPNSGHPTHPYLNIPDSSLIGSNSYNWKYAEVNDASGIPGQGNSNPASLFNNHQVVISGEYYDPSYGQKHASLQDIDDNAIDGYYIQGTYPVDEPAVNLDLNGDGDKIDLAVTTSVLLFRKNPAGLDLRETSYNY